MRCISLYKEQMDLVTKNNTKTDVGFSDFLDAYYQLFTKFNLLDLSKSRLEEIFTEQSSKIKEEDLEGFLAFALQLQKSIEKSAIRIQNRLNLVKLPDTILFIGDGTIDGHGLVMKDTAYGIFELSTLKAGLKQYHTDVFLTHELLHPIHYQHNSEFFSMNWKTTEEYYFKRMFSEGLATLLSKEISSVSLHEAYWFGFLEGETLNKWMDYCEKAKFKIGNKLMKSIEIQKIDPVLYRQLFSIEGFENMSEYRLAYYYGCEIVQSMHQKFSYQEILEMKYEEARPYILKYFEIE